MIETLWDDLEIENETVLYGVLNELKKLLFENKIKQVDGNVDLKTLPDKLPFKEDVIKLYFETARDREKYFLVCDTFMGVGGVFRKGMPPGYTRKQSLA